MRFSIVTPSFNQGRFLGQTIRSVLCQRDDVDLEYIVIDGGSNDESVSIIESYRDELDYWVSEPDDGQYDAINKGFARSTGDVMAWLNSDDMYTPWALRVVGEVFQTFPEIEWLTTRYPLKWDVNGNAVQANRYESLTRSGFLRGDHLPGRDSWGSIQQESTFWRRSLWESAGGRVDASLSMAGDYELWARFFRHADLYVLSTPLGGFRIHREQKTTIDLNTYVREARRVLVDYGGSRRSHLSWLIRTAWQRLPLRLRQSVGLFELTIFVEYDRGRGWRIARK